MIRPRTALACAAAAALVGAPAALGAPGEQMVPPAPTTPPTSYSNSRLIVEWAGGADHVDKAGAREDAEVEYANDLGNRRFQLVEAEPGQTARDAIGALREDPAVLVAERDATVSTNSIPNDPLFGELWGLQNTGSGVDDFVGALPGADVDAPAAWDQTTGSSSVVVADIDTGYRFEHPDLENRAWTNPGEIAGNSVDDDSDGIVDDVHGADFIGNNGEAPTTDGNPTDEDLISGGHGVHTAGTIGAEGDNGVGITGVAQDVRIMPLRVCSRFPSAGKSSCLISSIVAAINYAAAHHAKVANMSLGGNSAFQTEVNALAAAKETLFVISAGNDGSDNDGGGTAPHGHHYPCDFTPQTQASPPVSGAIDNVVCVAATDQADGLASFSDWGATSVDLGAPGTETLSAFPVRHFVDETFEANDFGSKWTATGANGGFARTNEAPLTSFGMSDSPGAAPVAGSTHESTSATVSVPAGFSSCTLYQTRNVSLGGGAYTYEIRLNGSTVGSSSPGDSSGRFFFTLGSALQGGGNLTLRFRYTAGGSPGPLNGVWLDDIDLQCAEPVGQASGYEFLQGTSMAAPHVTGGAALLFSHKPAATVTEVRDALLTGVDAIPSLSGKTTTGGRLDIAKALSSLDGNSVDHTAPAAPSVSTEPASGADDNDPAIKGSAEAGSKVTLFRGTACAGAPIATVTAAQFASPGIGVTVPDNSISFFSALATDAARNRSSCAQTSYVEDTPEVAITSLNPTHGPTTGGNQVVITGSDFTGTSGAAGVKFGAANATAYTVDSDTQITATAPSGDGTVRVAVTNGANSSADTAADDYAYEALKQSIANPAGPTNPLGEATLTFPPPPIPSSLCTVPRLAGKRLGQAKAALSGAGCALGTVVSPKPKKGRKLPPLVVKSSSPSAGAKTSGKVSLTLGPKPKPKKRHH